MQVSERLLFWQTSNIFQKLDMPLKTHFYQLGSQTYSKLHIATELFFQDLKWNACLHCSTKLCHHFLASAWSVLHMCKYQLSVCEIAHSLATYFTFLLLSPEVSTYFLPSWVYFHKHHNKSKCSSVRSQANQSPAAWQRRVDHILADNSLSSIVSHKWQSVTDVYSKCNGTKASVIFPVKDLDGPLDWCESQWGGCRWEVEVLGKVQMLSCLEHSEGPVPVCSWSFSCFGRASCYSHYTI